MLLVGGLKKTATTTTLAVQINCKTGSMREINLAANADLRCRHKVIKKKVFLAVCGTEYAEVCNCTIS